MLLILDGHSSQPTESTGRCITIFQVARLFRDTSSRVATLQTAEKGFEKMGIYPVNSDILSEHVIAPSETTERPSDNYSKNDEVQTMQISNPNLRHHHVAKSIV